MGKPLSIWTRYSELGASSRLRFFQFRSSLQAAGWDPEYHSFYEEKHLRRLYQGKGKDPCALLCAWTGRWRELRRTPKLVPMLIEYELLPYLPWAVEKKFLIGHPYILNFDDAVFLRYEHLPGFRRKYEELCRHAAGIITANEELTGLFSRFQKNIIKIPTVPPSRPVAEIPKEKDLTLVWIGTPVTFEYLRQHGAILRAMAQEVPFRLRVIASSRLPGIPGVPTDRFDWSPETENALLASAHIGIMPLPDTPFARGKSACKLIQYAVAGLPSIASSVGENRFVVREGKTGILADTQEQWIQALKMLAGKETRQAMLPAIREHAARFSPEKTGDMLCRFLAETF